MVSPVGAFALTGDMFRLKCPCGGSALEIQLGKEKVRLVVPCVACPPPHHYNMSRQLFFPGHFPLPALTSVGCAFISSRQSARATTNLRTRRNAGVDSTGSTSPTSRPAALIHNEEEAVRQQAAY